MGLFDVFSKGGKYFGKAIEPKCEYCEHGKRASDGNKVLCTKKGMVDAGYHCTKFLYSPLKRIPVKQLERVGWLEGDYEEKDFAAIQKKKEEEAKAAAAEAAKAAAAEAKAAAPKPAAPAPKPAAPVPPVTPAAPKPAVDGKVDATDARLALRAAAKLDTLTGQAFTNADVDGSGIINAEDARKILRVAAKLESF